MNVTNMRQEDLSKAVSGLPLDCSVHQVHVALEHFFVAGDIDGDANFLDEGNITPLMVACDKGNVTCLEYFKAKLVDEAIVRSATQLLIGKPSDKSRVEQNTALHHAAMAGCGPAIFILASMMNASNKSTAALALGKACNSHGDTPLMMAVASGHLIFCRAWQELCKYDTGESSDSLRDVWGMLNDSRDSCLSLACGHGQKAVVDFLVSECQVEIQSSTVDKCRYTFRRMESALKASPNLLGKHQAQLESVGVGLRVLEDKMSQKAELVAAELLQTTKPIAPIPHNIHTKAQKKGKAKRKKPKGSKSKESSSAAPDEGKRNDDGTGNLHLTMLSDGTTAVRVQGMTTMDLPQHEQFRTTQRAQPSANQMFRERFEGEISAEVDSVMKALCLDVSMLLYTPHGMALDLSPSQLDAIQGILQRQLVSVQEARSIQERMHATSSTPS